MGFQKVIFECDAIEIVDYIHHNAPPTSVSHNILEACRRELRSFEVWKLKAIVHKQNHVVDSLVKMAGRFSKGMHILSSYDPSE